MTGLQNPLYLPQQEAKQLLQTKETKAMKAKVIKNLLKAGFNEKSVNTMVEAHFDYVVKTYPEAKPAKVADIISTLWSMS